jgi:hypothetical protein
MAAQVQTEAKKNKHTSVEYMRDRDNEKVQGVFRYYEVPGGVIDFVFRAYKGDRIERYTLRDGEIYSIPRGVMRHLNKDCWYPEYEYASSEPGAFQKGIDPYNPKSSMRIGKKVKRMAFESMEFVTLDDVPDAKPILTVEYT